MGLHPSEKGRFAVQIYTHTVYIVNSHMIVLLYQQSHIHCSGIVIYRTFTLVSQGTVYLMHYSKTIPLLNVAMTCQKSEKKQDRE